MIILDGKKIADRTLDELKEKVTQMERPPVLVIISVDPNKATKSYLRAKKIAAERVGIELRITNYCHSEARRSALGGGGLKNPVQNEILHPPSRRVQDDTQNKIIQDIKNLNNDFAVDAIMVQLPLPPELDRDKILSAIVPHKDVEKEALTPKAILRLLDEYKISIKGKQVVIVGAGFLVGKPLVKLMKERGAKVTMLGLDSKGCLQLTKEFLGCTYPKTLDKCKLPSVTKKADILVSCCGDPNSIKKEMIKPGAVVVDCGSPEGDVDCEKISKIAAAITPVPGGVGPMTVAMLMEKTVELCYDKINGNI